MIILAVLQSRDGRQPSLSSFNYILRQPDISICSRRQAGPGRTGPLSRRYLVSLQMYSLFNILNDYVRSGPRRPGHLAQEKT